MKYKESFNNPNFYIYTTVTDPDKWELDYLIKSVEKFGGEITILVSSKPIGRLPIGFNQKVLLIHQQLKNHKDDDVILLVDGYDIIFVAPIEEIKRKYINMNLENKLLFSGERSQWPTVPPYDNLKALYPSDIQPYHYLNSGIIIGTVKGWNNIITPRLDEINTQIIDDQGFYSQSYVKNINKEIVIDKNCDISQNLVGEQKEDLMFDSKLLRWKNTVTNSYPCILQDNGTKQHENIKIVGDSLDLQKIKKKNLIYF
jgi:Cft2 family RNA processing exonuclease